MPPPHKRISNFPPHKKGSQIQISPLTVSPPNPPHFDPPHAAYRIPLGVLSLLLESGQLPLVTDGGEEFPDEEKKHPEENDARYDPQDDRQDVHLWRTLWKRPQSLKPTEIIYLVSSHVSTMAKMFTSRRPQSLKTYRNYLPTSK